MAGRFITFEGGEGSGKSTQIRRLGARLEEQGHAVVVTREPGGSPRAEAIRRNILAGDGQHFGPFAEALLFAAARQDHLDAVIRPALARGAVVLCDRFIDSTSIYQGALGQVPPHMVEALHRVVVGATRPDLTLILDVHPKVGLARAEGRRRAAGERVDRFEAEGLAFHTRLRDAFRGLNQREPGRCVLIDGDADPDTVEQQVWHVVARRIFQGASPLEGVGGLHG